MLAAAPALVDPKVGDGQLLHGIEDEVHAMRRSLLRGAAGPGYTPYRLEGLLVYYRPTMSEAPVSSSAKTDAKISVANQDDTRESGDAKSNAPVPTPADKPLVVIALGVLSAILFIIVVGFWIKVSAQNTTVVEKQNRIDQYGSGMTQLQAQLEDAKADSVKLQTQIDDANTKSSLLNSLVEKTKAGATELQTQLDKARAISNGFQSQMEDANVTSIRHQGEVEVAKAQVTVMQTQLADAKTETARVQAQLNESRTTSAALQEKLEKAEKTIAQLPAVRPQR